MYKPMAVRIYSDTLSDTLLIRYDMRITYHYMPRGHIRAYHVRIRCRITYDTLSFFNHINHLTPFSLQCIIFRYIGRISPYIHRCFLVFLAY